MWASAPPPAHIPCGLMTGWGEAGGVTTYKEWAYNTEGKGVQTGSREHMNKRHEQAHIRSEHTHGG